MCAEDIVSRRLFEAVPLIFYRKSDFFMHKSLLIRRLHSRLCGSQPARSWNIHYQQLLHHDSSKSFPRMPSPPSRSSTFATINSSLTDLTTLVTRAEPHCHHPIFPDCEQEATTSLNAQIITVSRSLLADLTSLKAATRVAETTLEHSFSGKEDSDDESPADEEQDPSHEEVMESARELRRVFRLYQQTQREFEQHKKEHRGAILRRLKPDLVEEDVERICLRGSDEVWEHVSMLARSLHYGFRVMLMNFSCQNRLLSGLSMSLTSSKRRCTTRFQTR